jgi:valyl-tRNA synthetase
MKPQWWVNCKGMAEQAMKAVTEGKLDIQPKSSEKEWFKWLSDIQDWCISRQLWWGHRIPAYRVILEDNAKSVSGLFILLQSDTYYTSFLGRGNLGFRKKP